jgi:hypothetical protein
MQLTRFDRWLRETYVYQTQIRTLRPPESLPKGIRRVEEPEIPGNRYKYLYIANNSRAADQLFSQLRENCQMHTTQIVDRKTWLAPFLAPKDKSVSWWLFSAVLFSVCGFFMLLYLKSFVDDPEFRKNFADALKLIKS